MKYSISPILYFLVLLALLLQGAPAGNTFAQMRQSGEIKMSPEAWPQGELEKYWQLQKDYNRRPQAVESTEGMVAVTSDAFAARVGLEALQQGGSAADAALGAALAQVALNGGAMQGNRPITSRIRWFYVEDFKQIASIPTRLQPLGLNAAFQCFFLL